MVELKKITEDDVSRILLQQESSVLDFKSSDIAPSKLSQTISAFANSYGGEIYIGISEADAVRALEWYGFKNIEAANPIFQTLSVLDPAAEFHQATFYQEDNQTGLVLHLIIQKARQIVKTTDEKVYIRKNAQNLCVKETSTLRKLELDKGITSYEDQTVNIEKDDVANSSTIIKFIINVVPLAEPETWLYKQKLIHEDKPTVAATMLFHDEPQIALPKRSAIKIIRYKSKDQDGTRDTLATTPVTIEGCAYDLITQAVLRVKTTIEEISIMGEQGLEKLFYPDEALHEIITNAVLHRDYSIPTDIQILVFDNRVEVISPGRLPGYITVDNILEEQYARNPKLVRLINKFPNPPNKDVGEGLNTAFEAMKKHRLKSPVVEENDNNVTVIIRHETLASPHETIMRFLDKNSEINNRTARELTGITSENSMKRVFYDLKDKNLIEPVPDKKGSASAWRKPLIHKPAPPSIAKDLFDFADKE